MVYRKKGLLISLQIFLPVNSDINIIINRYRQICIKVDASIFDSALSHTRRSDASEKKEKKKNTRVHFGANSPVDKFRVLACIGYGLKRGTKRSPHIISDPHNYGILIIH